MKSKFALGAMAGASALVLSVPIALQFAGAQSVSSSSSATVKADRPIPSQACVTAMAGMEDHFLQNADAMIAAQKASALAHKNALLEAAKITDDTERGEALKAAQEARHAAMEAVMGTQTEPTAQMEAMKTACGDMMQFRMMKGPGGPGMGMMFKGGKGHMMKGMKFFEKSVDPAATPTTQQ